jgi:RNA polymerase sigma factor (sigma-70 family)
MSMRVKTRSAHQPSQWQRGRTDLPSALTNPFISFVYNPDVAEARDDRIDRNLFRDLAAGRSSALGDLYDRHAASLFRHALALTRRREEAEDLVHTTFTKLATTGEPLLGVHTPTSYLHRALHTAWIDICRRAAVGQRVMELADRSRLEDALDEASIDLARALDQLPPEQREVVVLHVTSGFSFREIGQMTGVSLFTAAARYRLARTKLRATLGSTDGGGTA